MKTTQSDTNGGDEYEVTAIKTAKCDQSDDHVYSNEVDTRGERWFVWHGILFEEPNPTGSRPSDLIGLYRQQKKPHPPNTQGRARREHGGEQGHPEEAESHPEEAERRRKDREQEGGEGGGDQESPEGAGRREGAKQREDREGVGVEEQTGLRCGEANPNMQHMKPHPPNTQGRARRKHGVKAVYGTGVLIEEPNP